MAGIAVSAQSKTYEVGGMFGFWHDSNGHETTFDLNPDFSCNLSDTWGVGLMLEYSHVKHDAGKMRITSTGSSSVRTDGTSSGVSVFSESSAELRLAGSSGSVNIVGSGKSVINADGLETGEASVKLSGPAHCIVNATGNLKVDLSGGSHLIFNGTPAIEVVRISSSSMTRPGETK